MTTRAKIIKEAHEWMGTPYVHQESAKNIGVDCAGLVIGVALNTGIITPEEKAKVPTYSPEWHMHNRDEKLVGILLDFGCKEIPVAKAKAGDIITFIFGRVNSHLGILVTPTDFIHARHDLGRVCVNMLDGDWKVRAQRAFVFPGVKR